MDLERRRKLLCARWAGVSDEEGGEGGEKGEDARLALDADLSY